MSEVESARVSTFDGYIDEYEDACARGVSLSGESRDFFARARVNYSAGFVSRKMATVVDYGCGLGHSVGYLATAFAARQVIGYDTAAAAVARARQLHGTTGITFTTNGDDIPRGSVDLVYTNGTFHHIEPADRAAAVSMIRRWLKPRGVLVFWENNPWNPGTRLVMRRIPFDRDASMLSARSAVKLLQGGAFNVATARFFFFFPSFLRSLRRVEPLLRRVPLGAQYCLLARTQL